MNIKCNVIYNTYAVEFIKDGSSTAEAVSAESPEQAKNKIKEVFGEKVEIITVKEIN